MNAIARTLASVMTPASVLAEILRSDPTRPRVTFYEDTPGPTHGERIELSGKVVANWISKAGNALQDEYDLGPGSVVRLTLPPHLPPLYWPFTVWPSGGPLACAGGPRRAGPPFGVSLPQPGVTQPAGRLPSLKDNPGNHWS